MSYLTTQEPIGLILKTAAPGLICRASEPNGWRPLIREAL